MDHDKATENRNFLGWLSGRVEQYRGAGNQNWFWDHGDTNRKQGELFSIY